MTQKTAPIKNGKEGHYICVNDDCQAIVSTVYGTRLVKSRGKVIIPVKWVCERCFYEYEEKKTR